MGEQVRRLIARDDKPLSEKDAAKEEEKIRKLTDKRKNENEEQRKKRLETDEKDREDARNFVGEVADAYNFRLIGIENLDGRETYVIDAEPRPDFQPHLKEAKILPKFRFRAWIDQAESQWVKLDAECIDTVSVGWFLARIHKGSRLLIDQTRINDEVWLPRHVAIKVDVRVALLKNFNVEADVTYRDYKKFRTDTKIVPVGGCRSSTEVSARSSGRRRNAWVLHGLKAVQDDKRCGSVLLFGHFEAGLGSFERIFGVSEVGFRFAVLQSFLGPPLGFLGALHIDFLRTLGSFGQDGDLVRQHFGKAPGHGQIVRLATLAIGDFAHRQAR